MPTILSPRKIPAVAAWHGSATSTPARRARRSRQPSIRGARWRPPRRCRQLVPRSIRRSGQHCVDQRGHDQTATPVIVAYVNPRLNPGWSGEVRAPRIQVAINTASALCQIAFASVEIDRDHVRKPRGPAVARVTATPSRIDEATHTTIPTTATPTSARRDPYPRRAREAPHERVRGGEPLLGEREPAEGDVRLGGAVDDVSIGLPP